MRDNSRHTWYDLCYKPNVVEVGKAEGRKEGLGLEENVLAGWLAAIK